LRSPILGFFGRFHYEISVGFTGVRLAVEEEKDGRRATASVLIGLPKLFEMEVNPWPERSLSESAAS